MRFWSVLIPDTGGAIISGLRGTPVRPIRSTVAALHCPAAVLSFRCTALHYPVAALHCTPSHLHNTAQHCTALHYAAMHCTALHSVTPALFGKHKRIYTLYGLWIYFGFPVHSAPRCPRPQPPLHWLEEREALTEEMKDSKTACTKP